MKKFLYSTKNIPAADYSDKEFSVEYYIVESGVIGESCNAKSYGIEVVRRREEADIIYSEAKTIENISSNEHSIIQLAKVLSTHTVTPYFLEEIFDEIKKLDRFKSIFEESNTAAAV